MTLKLHCASCDSESSVETFSIDGGELRVVCPSCGESSSIRPAAAASPSSDEGGGDDSETMECTKCGLRQAPREACIRCGLRAELMSEYRDESDEDDAVISARWNELEGSWAEVELHEQFIAYAIDNDAYLLAARRYRRAAARGRPQAQEYLDRIGRMAHGLLDATRPATSSAEVESQRSRAALWVILALAVLAIGAGAMVVIKKRQGPAPVPPPMERLR